MEPVITETNSPMHDYARSFMRTLHEEREREAQFWLSTEVEIKEIIEDMDKCVEAPKSISPSLHPRPYVFLAGGISNCSDWQKEVVKALRFVSPMTLINPRRQNYPDNNSLAAQEQIVWEHKMIELANIVSFWFPKETDCPITLYELGATLQKGKTVLVGVHPEYKRRFDVLTQTRLVRPDIFIVDSLEELTDQIRLAPYEERPV